MAVPEFDSLGLLDGVLAALALGVSILLLLVTLVTYRRVRNRRLLWLVASFVFFGIVGAAWVLDPATSSLSSLTARAALVFGLLLVYAAIGRR